MIPSERTDHILNILNKQKYVTPKFLATKLYCSPATIRRDLIDLEKSGLLKRHHGNVTLIPKLNVEQPNFFREMKHIEEKKYICKLGKGLISDGDSLFLDSSSTVMNICPELDGFINLTVITSGIKTALELSKNEAINSFLVGGQIKPNSASIVGELTSELINKFKGTLCIISCGGIDQDGVYEADHSQAMVKEQMIKNSDRTILLCDSSKFEKSHFFKLSSFDKIDMVITNQKPCDHMIQSLIQANVEILW